MDDRATLASALAGRYDIEREVGRGGMATVYLAHDVRHDRDVAVKVLHPDLGAALGSERFLTEIRTTAKLQHPHILPLLDSGDANGLLFYVMPMVTGESLRARLDRERLLPIPEAIRIARKVAGALDYAHRHGVIHRDIKPENILLHDGQALVADFGIALAVTSAGGQRMTQTGLSLGTPQYMSPEQAMGEKSIDARTDIYALGAVTYEMLAGDAPFTGSSVQAVVAKMMNERPTPLRTLRDTVPLAVEHAVFTALAKLAVDRYATAADFAAALSAAGEPSTSRLVSPAQATQVSRAPLMSRLAVPCAAIAMISVAVAAWALLHSPRVTEIPVIRMTIDLGPGERTYRNGSPVISPRGDRIAYVVQTPAGSRTLTRWSSELTAREIAPTPLVNRTFSPDGRWIAYTADNAIRRIPADGGASAVVGQIPQSLTPPVTGLAWTSDNTIVFGSEFGLWSIPANGGTAHRLEGADTTKNATFPLVLPGGKTIVYIRGFRDVARLAVTSMGSHDAVTLPIASTSPVGMVDGHLIYVTVGGDLMAVPFDAKRRRVTGDPVHIEAEVAGAALSATGTLAYQQSQGAAILSLEGPGTESAPLLPEARAYSAPRYSPDARKVAVAVGDPTASDIWMYDLAAHTFTRITTEGSNTFPEWSPDGKRVLFVNVANDGRRTVMWQAADGSAKAELLFRPDYPINEAIMSPDGNWLLYRTAPNNTYSRDIFAVPLNGDRRPIPIVTGPASEVMPRLSPDGKWLAYVSDEGSIRQVYVRPFPGPGPRVQVSDKSGNEPVWARSGRALLYSTGEGIVSVAVTTGATFSVGERHLVLAGYDRNSVHANYDIAPDGTHILRVKQVGGDPQIIVVHNWKKELLEKLGAGAAKP